MLVFNHVDFKNKDLKFYVISAFEFVSEKIFSLGPAQCCSHLFYERGCNFW